MDAIYAENVRQRFDLNGDDLASVDARARSDKVDSLAAPPPYASPYLDKRLSLHDMDDEAARDAEQNISQISDDILAMMNALTTEGLADATVHKRARGSLRQSSLPVIPDEDEDQDQDQDGPHRYYSTVETQDDIESDLPRTYSIIVPDTESLRHRPSALSFVISPSTSMSLLPYSPTTSSSQAASPTSYYWSSSHTSANPSEDDSFDADTPNCLPVPPKYAPHPDPISALAESRRLHAARGAALDTLDTLSSALDSLRASFVPPQTLDFHPPTAATLVSAPTSDVPFSDVAPFYQLAPGIARTRNNEPARAYRRELRRLIVKLNNVDVAEDASLNYARSELVQAVDYELSRFKWWKARVWSAAEPSLSKL